MRLLRFHLERKVAIKPKSVFKIRCHIQVLSSSRCLGYYTYSFWSDLGNESPLQPKHSLTSGSVKRDHRNAYFCDSESQASTVTLQNCCAHAIHSRHFLLHVLFATYSAFWTWFLCRASWNGNQLVPVSTAWGIRWRSSRVEQHRFYIAQGSENTAKCKTTFWV